MIIAAIITLLVVAGIGWAICAAIPRGPRKDEEQEEYLKKWRKKHGESKKLLKEERIKQGLSQQQLAEAAGVSKRAIAH